ncbi:hypothetical protein V2H31_10835 [Streptococcus suis]|uniref:hypothetical protein n=1 Tax=Streptococcus suis TaxID=1307 RepID=UPI002EA187B8|nr:hypothetical protein [Streptococcus suis]
MENFQFWLTFGTATIPAAITGLLSFGASWIKNRSDIKAIKIQFEHEMEKLSLSHKHELENIERQHSQELDALKQSHDLRLLELEKVSKLDAETDLALKQNELIYKVMTGEVNLDSVFSSADKVENYNQKQNLKKQFVQKLSKK